MSKLSRRDLLRFAGALGLSVAAGACSRRPSEVAQIPQPTAYPTAASAPRLTASATLAPTVSASRTVPAETQPTEAAALPPTPEPAVVPDMAIVRGENVEAMVAQAIDALGGIQRFVQPGYDVIVKPNICNANHGPEYASTTHPLVVAALVRLCLEAGASQVRVMDNPFAGTAEQAYVTSQIGAAVEAAGGAMEIMAPHRFVEAEIPEGRDIRQWRFYKPILDADLVINVPIAKHHGLAKLTLGGKNMMGCIEDRGGIHRNLGQRIADIVSRVRPALTMIDATRILVANGPTGGSLDDVRITNTIIASPDLVAADAWATSLFDLRPEDISYIVKAHEMGLGTMDLSQLRLVELAV